MDDIDVVDSYMSIVDNICTAILVQDYFYEGFGSNTPSFKLKSLSQ